MNQEIAKILFEIAEYLAMDEVPFKPRAYEKAAQTIADLEEDVRDIYARDGLKGLRNIPGVGQAISEKIEEYLTTGRLRYYDELKKAAPVDLSELSKVEGLGPKSIRKLYETLGVHDLATLEAAAQAGRIRSLPRFGEKTEENILKSIEFARSAGERHILGLVLPQIRAIEARLRRLPEVEELVLSGSARRRRDTIGDVDFLVISSDPQPVMDFFVALPEVVRVLGHGDTKSSVKIRGGLNIDLRVVPRASFGAALNYFTGSKAHNVTLRQLAIRRGWKLNEYGLYEGEVAIAGLTEEGIYQALGLSYIPPELRENWGEIEAAETSHLPDLVTYDGLQGDLHVHTDWSDGKESVEAMARAAVARGLKYIAITDHSPRLAMTHGLDAERLRKQWLEIDRVNTLLHGQLTVLKGVECDILKSGLMDLPDSILSQLDVVGGSIHSYFNVPRREQTARLVRALENPHVDVIFHPTGRIINRRTPCDLDIDRLIRAARDTQTLLEIDSYPDRSDLCDEYVRKCVTTGAPLVIDSDAHASPHFDYLENGIAQARRGWAERKDIANAWPLSNFRKYLK